MSAERLAATPAPVGGQGEAAPARKRFVRRATPVRMPPDAAARQGRIATLAWTAFGDRDAVIAFLNGHDERLGGRPIDLAVADAAGLARAEAALPSPVVPGAAAPRPSWNATALDEPSEIPGRGGAG